MSEIDEKDLAMQMRCLNCGGENYGPNVWAISHGECACHNCGAQGVPMTETQYREKFRELRGR